jgi:branched-chain amino acid transport system substrate-binding protein
MRRAIVRIAAIPAATAIAAWLSSTPAVAQAANGPIKIGSFLSLTGAAAFLGEPEDKTLRLYVDDANAKGGIAGRRLQLIVSDDAGDADKARTFGRRLIEDDKVDVLIGGTTTATTMAIVPLVEAAQVPLVSLAGAVVVVDPVKKWVFKTPHTDLMACQKIFQDLAKRGIGLIGFLSEAGAFGRSMRDECVKIAPRYDIQIMVEESYGAEETDMSSHFAKIKGAGLQALVDAGFGQGPVTVLRAYQQLGLTLPFYESHGVAAAQFIKMAGSAADGVRLPAAALPIADLLPDSDPQKPVVMDYRQRYEKRWTMPASTFGGYAFDAFAMTVAAMKRAATIDRAAIRDEIERTRNFVDTAGTVNMSSVDHLGLDASAFRLLEIRNGTWTLLN